MDMWRLRLSMEQSEFNNYIKDSKEVFGSNFHCIYKDLFNLENTKYSMIFSKIEADKKLTYKELKVVENYTIDIGNCEYLYMLLNDERYKKYNFSREFLRFCADVLACNEYEDLLNRLLKNERVRDLKYLSKIVGCECCDRYLSGILFGLKHAKKSKKRS